MKRPTIIVFMLGAAALAALIGVGCSAATPSPGAATDPALTQWSDVSTHTQPTLDPTSTGQADYEPTAASTGSVPYSGYACTFAADGCTCDSAVVIKAEFTFLPGEKMTYEFHGDTYGAAWDMSRLAPNQWSYTIPIGVDETSGTPTVAGHYFTVLTFTPDGFTLIQSEDRGDGTQVTCPEVPYTRLSAVTPGP